MEKKFNFFQFFRFFTQKDAEGVEHRVVVLQRKQTNASRIKIEK